MQAIIIIIDIVFFVCLSFVFFVASDSTFNRDHDGHEGKAHAGHEEITLYRGGGGPMVGDKSFAGEPLLRHHQQLVEVLDHTQPGVQASLKCLPVYSWQ